jgi:hypothetical protein
MGRVRESALDSQGWMGWIRAGCFKVCHRITAALKIQRFVLILLLKSDEITNFFFPLNIWQT